MADAETPDGSDSLRQRYDATPYHDQSFAAFDLARLLGFAQLFGLVDAETVCEGPRVLDLGCASGLHLREQARRHPGARFTGIDFSQTEIDLGRKAIEAEGIGNVELIAADLREVALEGGAYDVVLCHGIFSWVPDDVKERILLLCRQALAPGGVAAIAYLTYPGWKQREAIRELVAMRDRPGRPPEERVRESALLLRFRHAGYASREHDPAAASLREVVECMQKSPRNAFLHDELGPVHDPCYFLQFVEWARECGLAYLAETDLGSMSAQGLDASASGLLRALDPDFLETQQLVDFVLNRSGRSSLLVRDDARPDRAITPERLAPLRLGTSWWRVTPKNAPAGTPARFESDGGRSLEVEDPCVRFLLMELAADRVASLAHAELLARAERAGHDGEAVATALVGLVGRGVVEARALVA